MFVQKTVFRIREIIFLVETSSEKQSFAMDLLA